MPVPVARLTVTPAEEAAYDAAFTPEPPSSVSAPAPPTSVSSPAPPFSESSPLLPVRLSANPDPITLWMLVSTSPCASPPMPVPVARLTVTPDEEPAYDAAFTPEPPSSVSAPAPPDSVSSPAPPLSDSLLLPPVRLSAYPDPTTTWMLLSTSP